MARASSRIDTPEFVEPDRDTLVVRGALTFATVGEACVEGSRKLAAGAQTHLDLGGVTQVDSAGLACVIALVAAANRNGRRLTILHWPDGLRALADVCDAGTLLDTRADLA